MGVDMDLAQAEAATASGYDRAFLNSMLDQFLQAVIANEPSLAPLWIGFRETVNSVVTPAGEGVWQTATAFDADNRRFFDPQGGSAALLGLMYEGEERAIVSLRLCIKEDRIAEAEWHVGRRNDPSPQGFPGQLELYDPEGMVQRMPATRVIAQTERVSRAALVAIANSYFDGLSSQNPRAVIAHCGCTRTENGLNVTTGPIKKVAGKPGFIGVEDCMAGYEQLGIVLVQARRFPLVDEEQQVVLGSGVFIRQPGLNKRRLHFMEYFYIDHQRLRHTEAALFYVDPAQPVPNWPPNDGNFPLSLPTYLPL